MQKKKKRIKIKRRIRKNKLIKLPIIIILRITYLIIIIKFLRLKQRLTTLYYSYCKWIDSHCYLCSPIITTITATISSRRITIQWLIRSLTIIIIVRKSIITTINISKQITLIIILRSIIN